MQVYGITGSVMKKRGQIDLTIGEASPHTFRVVQELPMDCDLLIGQDWLQRFGYQFQIPELGITLPAYSETLVRVSTKEKGTRLIESQELQENIFRASSVVDCAEASFVCLIINCNPIEKTLSTFPQVHEIPKLSGRFVENNSKNPTLGIKLYKRNYDWHI
jgi:hypothetical protein